jgi:hypothetical protein
MQTTEWREFLAKLKGGPTISGTPGEKNWKQHVKEISTPCQVVSITEDDWNYWLEVLPPRWASGSHFCFAEGDEPFRLFWTTRENQFFGRQLTIEETLTFCRFVEISAPRIQPSTSFVSEQELEFIEQHFHPRVEDCCGD